VRVTTVIKGWVKPPANDPLVKTRSIERFFEALSAATRRSPSRSSSPKVGPVAIRAALPSIAMLALSFLPAFAQEQTVAERLPFNAIKAIGSSAPKAAVPLRTA
jgi:hypothetical protein